MYPVVGPHPLVDIALAVAGAHVQRLILLVEIDEQLHKVRDVVLGQLQILQQRLVNRRIQGHVGFLHYADIYGMIVNAFTLSYNTSPISC